MSAYSGFRIYMTFMTWIQSLTTVAPFPPQRDPHTVYLEQELESLKVVLDMKNNQLHLQEKRLMEMDKLVGAGYDHSDC